MFLGKHKFYLMLLSLVLLTSCSSVSVIQDSAPMRQVDISTIPNAIPKVEPFSKYGNSPAYVVNGRKYFVLQYANGYDKTGIGSWYGTKFHGHLTSTREVYNMFAMTAASTTLPLPTYARVTNLENGRQIIVKVNDRGPFDKDRIIDLSYVAAKKLGYDRSGTALVRVTAINPYSGRQPVTAGITHVLVTHKPQLFLQIGAFANKNNAANLRMRINQFTTESSRIISGNYSHQSIYRVQLGPLKNSAENDKLQQLLAQHGFGQALSVVE